MELMVEHLGHGLGLALLLSLPAVLAAASVGLVVGILQAVTQVQEQTISAAPKILAVFLIILLGGGIMMNLLTGYIRESMAIAFNEIPLSEDTILPPLESQPERSRARAFFAEQLKGNTGKISAMSQFPGTNTKDQSRTGSDLSIQKSSQPGSPLSITDRMSLQKKGQ